MASPNSNLSFSPNSPNKESKIFRDIITTPYEKVLKILYDIKIFISKYDNSSFLLNQLDWVISIISSHTLYDFTINDSQNKKIEKYQKEIPEFKNFINFISEYNGQINIMKRYSDLINESVKNLEDKHSATFEKLGLLYPSLNYKKNTISILRNSIFKSAITFDEANSFLIKSKSEEKKIKKNLKDLNNNNTNKIIRRMKNSYTINYEIKDEFLQKNKKFSFNNAINKIKKIKSNPNILNILGDTFQKDRNLKTNLKEIKSINNIKLNANKEILNFPNKKKKNYRHQSTTKEIEKINLSPLKNFSQISNLLELEKKLTQTNFPINSIMKPNFNIHELKNIIGYNNVLPLIGKIIFHFFSLNEKIININKLDNFLQSISKHYNQNVLYHNSIHAADVTQNIAFFINNSNFEEKIYTNINDILSLLTASLGHDLGHPGLNTNYLINSYDEKTLIYNDISPLENYHSSLLFKIIRKDSCNIFDKFSDFDFRTLRKRIICEILSTDMKIHSKVLSVIKSKLINNPNKILISKDSKNIFEEQQSIFNFIVHCADISHNAKSFDISLKWVKLLSLELWKQGDKEKEKNLPISFLCDRNNYDIPKSQIGFIKGFIIPTFDVLTEIFPSLLFLKNNAFNNLKIWENLSKDNRKKGWSLDKSNNSYSNSDESSYESFSENDNDSSDDFLFDNNNDNNNNDNNNDDDNNEPNDEKLLIINLLNYKYNHKN